MVIANAFVSVLLPLRISVVWVFPIIPTLENIEIHLEFTRHLFVQDGNLIWRFWQYNGDGIWCHGHQPTQCHKPSNYKCLKRHHFIYYWTHVLAEPTFPEVQNVSSMSLYHQCWAMDILLTIKTINCRWAINHPYLSVSVVINVLLLSP